MYITYIHIYMYIYICIYIYRYRYRYRYIYAPPIHPGECRRSAGAGSLSLYIHTYID